MRTIHCTLLFLVSVTIPQLSAAPTINSIANAASLRGFAAPLAPGGIFIIKGNGLGPADLSIASAPFQSTSLSGTSIDVTVGSATVKALMYYTSANQVAALLPSNTPTGSGTFTVTYNGQTSNSVGHGIAFRNMGIFTLDSSGQGPAIVTYADYSLVSAAKVEPCGGPYTTCGAANPGDTLVLWGTGLGPVSGDDASGAGLGQPMPDIPLTVWLGGVQAPVAYQGRSGCCIGLDQIVFTVPPKVPTGCAVPLVVQIGGQISNTTVLPVADGSRNCTTTNPALANAEQGILAGPVTFADLELRKRSNDKGGYTDDLDFTFAKIVGYPPGTQPFFVSWIDDLPPGTCAVNNLNGGDNVPSGTNFALADGGSSLVVKGPNGSMNLAASPGEAHPILSNDGSFLVPGIYTVTGGGGADIGPFTASIAFPPFPKLVSPENNATVTRGNGMTVTWTGGDPNGYLRIVITSAVDPAFTLGVQAFCNVPAGPGTFTIPPYVLLALPAGSFAGFTIAPRTPAVAFTAQGLNAGILATQIDGTGFGFGAGSGSFTLR